MNISHHPVHRAAPFAICLTLASLSLGTTFAANPDPAAATAAPKTHVLFMGADIALEKDKVFHPVEDVTATSLVIKPGGKPVNVPQAQSINFRISETLKIAATSVGVDDLKAERAYTPGADPFRKFASVASMAGPGQSPEMDRAQGALMMASGPGMRVVPLPTDTPEQAAGIVANGVQRDAQIGSLQSDLDQVQAQESDRAIDMTGQLSQMGVEETRKLFDAIRLSFNVTSEKNLAQPYYAVIAQIRERDSKPGQVRKWAYVKSLGPISAGQTKKVNVYQGGLPPGYILESYEVHLYNHGEELATNLSRKRVPLTDEEALEFRIIEYVGAHQGRTLPASLATTTLTSDGRASLTPAQLGQTCYVRVAKDGRVAAAFRDAAGQQTLQDPALEAALKTFRFKPALQAGKSVESIVPINLAQLATP